MYFVIDKNNQLSECKEIKQITLSDDSSDERKDVNTSFTSDKVYSDKTSSCHTSGYHGYGLELI